jgi:hypothetical protein
MVHGHSRRLRQNIFDVVSDTEGEERHVSLCGYVYCGDVRAGVVCLDAALFGGVIDMMLHGDFEGDAIS